MDALTPSVQGGWLWNGSQWICPTDPCPPFSPPFCPPFFPPPPFIPPPAGQPPWFPGANGGVTFSSTPPPNPVRGHFWWDGTSLHMFDGAAWVIISTGGTGTSLTGAGITVITSSAPPSPQLGSLWWDGTSLRVWDGTTFKLVGPVGTPGSVSTTTEVLRLVDMSTLTVPATTWSIVPFDATPIIDTQHGWNFTTRQFKPSIHAMYMFSCQCNLTTDTPAGILLAKNDTGTLDPTTADIVAENMIVGAAGDVVTAFGLSDLNGTTDFVRLWVFSNDGNIYPFPTPTIECWQLP